MRPSLPLQQGGCQAATIGAAAQSPSHDNMIAKYVLFENRYFYLFNGRVSCSLFASSDFNCNWNALPGITFAETISKS